MDEYRAISPENVKNYDVLRRSKIPEKPSRCIISGIEDNRDLLGPNTIIKVINPKIYPLGLDGKNLNPLSVITVTGNGISIELNQWGQIITNVDRKDGVSPYRLGPKARRLMNSFDPCQTLIFGS